MTKVGIIGNGNHSKKIQKILKEKKIDFFIYKPNKPNYFDSKEFNELKKYKVIFIISPHNTHYSYIKKLHKGRYIFCEKPPVNNKKDLIALKKLKLKKIYFNYNFRFMEISEVLIKRDKYKLKDLIYANLSVSHGLAQLGRYKKNWRASLIKCPKGIFETLSIHYIDLINYLFEVLKVEKPKLINSSKVGNTFDTSLVEIKLKNKALVNIFSTYNSSYAKNLFFLFKNGIVEMRNNIITISGPSLNLDKNGLFLPPKIKKIIKFDENKDYANSLYKSVSFFMDSVRNKKNFNKKSFDTSIKSNSLIL